EPGRIHLLRPKRYHLTYRLRLPPLPANAAVRIIAPWIRSTPAQRVVSVTEVRPERLRAFLDTELGVLYRAEGSAAELGQIEVSAEVVIHEVHAALHGAICKEEIQEDDWLEPAHDFAVPV